MRLWHKDLITVLPRQQLVSQWRECCCIARELAVNGTPNHLLVNKILGYPKHHFLKYAMLVAKEMERRDTKSTGRSFIGGLMYGSMMELKHVVRMVKNCLNIGITLDT